MPAFFSRPKKYPITEKPITSPTDKRIYQDIFNLIATFLNLFRDLDARLEEYVTEAPDDGKTYGRKDKDWTEIVSGDGIPEAPEDGQLYGRKDAAWEVVPGGGGSSTWGSITGTLSDQLDLQSALNSKENTVASGTTAQYYRGDKTWQTLNAGVIAGLGSAALVDIAYFATAIQGTLADSAVQPGDLAAVAFSGDYDDLSGDAPSDGSTYGRKDGAWVTVTGGGGGSLTVTTVSTTHGYTTLATGRVASLLKCTVDVACRIRIYCTSAGRLADASRLPGAQAANDVGLIFEFIATLSLLSADLNPVPTAHNGDATPGSVVYCNVEPDTSPTAAVDFQIVTLVA